MYTDRHGYSTAPPRPPQARKHGKNYAETKWPSCPTKGCLRRDGLTGHHDVTAMSAKELQFPMITCVGQPGPQKVNAAKHVFKHTSNEEATNRSRATM